MASTDPKIATQGQWEDLADRVQSKAEIGSVLSTPSNVAYVDTNNIVDAAVTTSKIADGAVTNSKIDFSTMTDANVIRFGNKKIMWGQVSFSAPSGQDTTAAVTFPESFNTTPEVMVTNQGWIAVRGTWAYNVGTSGCRVGIVHVQGSTTTANIGWVAIG